MERQVKIACRFFVHAISQTQAAGLVMYDNESAALRNCNRQFQTL